VLDLGLDELGGGEALLLVEWGDAVEALLPAEHLTIELATAGSGEDRTLAIDGIGGSWAERWPDLELALDPWRVP
jgi:tRNA A37 threonylcarbamoyladenosine biosynthesis protein TsaE